MNTKELMQLLSQTLEDNKAYHIKILDVGSLTDIAHHLIICSALSPPHLDALKNKVIKTVKTVGEKPLIVNGDRNSGWILVDLQDIIIHMMLPEIRDFYDLEKLWSMTKSIRNTESK